MNIALSTVLLFLCILPGIIIRSTVKKGPYRTLGFESPPNEPPYSHAFLQKAAFYLIASICSHALWILPFVYGFEYLTGITVCFNKLLTLLTNDYPLDPAVKRHAAAYIIDNRQSIAVFFSCYFLSIYILSWAGSLLFRWCIVKSRLDLRWSVLRLSPWFYYINGDYAKTREHSTDSDFKAPVASLLSTVITHGFISYLYVGVVYSVILDKDGNLDKVLLEKAWRRRLFNDREVDVDRISYNDDPRFYSIEGSYLILRYAEMKTLNVEYYIGTEIKDESNYWRWLTCLKSKLWRRLKCLKPMP